jgi:hypothetical protein
LAEEVVRGGFRGRARYAAGMKARSCSSCRAYEPRSVGPKGFRRVEYRCSLGYWQEDCVPKEDCPRPRTVGAFVAELKKGRKR